MAEETFNPFEGVKSPKVMVGMPAYNEEKSVGRIVSYAKKYAPFVVVVNDCSTDKTVEKAEAAGGFVVSHTINTGYGGAELTIFETARKYNPDVLVVLDSDGQHNPEDIPRFVEKIQEGYDVVIGSRYLDEESTKLIPAYRKLGMKALNKSVSISSKTIVGIAMNLLINCFRDSIIRLSSPPDAHFATGTGFTPEELKRKDASSLPVEDIAHSESCMRNTALSNSIKERLIMNMTRIRIGKKIRFI